MKILIAPFAAKLRNGNRNPKDYPYFPKLVALLNAEGHTVNQIGVNGEGVIAGVETVYFNRPLSEIVTLVNEHDLWVSVDSFLPHLCHIEGLKSGIVLWSQSDPRIFGHPENIALLRHGRYRYLREHQYQWWEETPYIEEAFVSAGQVFAAVGRYFTDREEEVAHREIYRYRPA